jgi:hypothetical protein
MVPVLSYAMNKWTVVVAMIIAASVVLLGTSISRIESQQAAIDALDVTTLLLDLKKVAPGDYIVLYSTSPKIIASGSVIAKLPCDDDSEPKDWMLLAGMGTDLSPLKLDLIQGAPGIMCAYIGGIPNEGVSRVSGIVLVNTSSDPIRLPRTSSVVITVHSVSAP